MNALIELKADYFIASLFTGLLCVPSVVRKRAQGVPVVFGTSKLLDVISVKLVAHVVTQLMILRWSGCKTKVVQAVRVLYNTRNQTLRV